MNKFEHFTEKEMDAVCQGAYFALTDTGDDRFNGLTVCLSSDFYKETAKNIINRALDAELVQRVVDDKPQDENKVEIGSNEYTLKKLPDGKVWMMENLREYVEGAIWNERYKCYMYTWEQAKKVVPKGFHLPSAQEFMKLAMALGYLKDDEEIVRKKLQDKCNFVFSGYAYNTGTLNYQGSDGYYWSSTQYDVTRGYGLYFDRSAFIPVDDYSKDGGMAVRLIKD